MKFKVCIKEEPGLSISAEVRVSDCLLEEEGTASLVDRILKLADRVSRQIKCHFAQTGGLAADLDDIRF